MGTGLHIPRIPRLVGPFVLLYFSPSLYLTICKWVGQAFRPDSVFSENYVNRRFREKTTEAWQSRARVIWPSTSGQITCGPTVIHAAFFRSSTSVRRYMDVCANVMRGGVNALLHLAVEALLGIAGHAKIICAGERHHLPKFNWRLALRAWNGDDRHS